MRAAYDDAARRQLGLLTTTQLTDIGWTYGEIRSAIDRDEFLRYGRKGILRCSGAEESQSMAYMAALLTAGADHWLGDLTAASVWCLPKYPEPDRIQLLTTSEARCRAKGVSSRRVGALPKADRDEVGRLRITSPARTLVDTCGEVSFEVLRAAASHALRMKNMRTVDLLRCVDRLPAKSSRPQWPARLLVASIVPGYDPGESDRELQIVETLVAAGYERPAQQIWVRGSGWRYRIDVGYPDLKHGFEYQSEQEHLNRESFHRDQLRTTRLQRAGWTMWPITSRTGRAELLAIAATIFGHNVLSQSTK